MKHIVGIITLNGYFNYGNRLQNYALQEAIKTLNFKCETIINKTYIPKKENNIKKDVKTKIINFSKKSSAEKIEIINNKIHKKQRNKMIKNRTETFERFSKQYINETNFNIKLGSVDNNYMDKYSYFISGSDQVWNPNDVTVSEINFMTFAPRQKRLTYAPSFGVSNIPDKYKNEYRKWLDGIDNISVREDEGAKIIKELTGKDAHVLIDPTMLISKEKWLLIAQPGRNKPQKKYLLTYFLGGISKEYRKKIKKISKENDLNIVNLADIKDKKYYCEGPSEFIDYINSASVLFTDSFHGCVFSLLLETPFVVCNRLGHTKQEMMQSRIDTFLKKFNLEDRAFEKIIDTNVFCIKNYEKANKILEKEREVSWQYLNDILEIKK